MHPQSVVHSAVEYADGAVIAQMGTPDMAVPIQYALTWPHRAPTDARRLSLTDYGSLTFEKPDCGTFVCLDICIEAARRSGLYPCAVNAANEYAVGAFWPGSSNSSTSGGASGTYWRVFPVMPMSFTHWKRCSRRRMPRARLPRRTARAGNPPEYCARR